MCEKESTGMSFSGHLLDNYQKHIETLPLIPIPDILASGDDESVSSTAQVPIFRDRQIVKVAGIVSGITHKMTKKEEHFSALPTLILQSEFSLLLKSFVFPSMVIS